MKPSIIRALAASALLVLGAASVRAQTPVQSGSTATTKLTPWAAVPAGSYKLNIQLPDHELRRSRLHPPDFAGFHQQVDPVAAVVRQRLVKQHGFSVARFDVPAADVDVREVGGVVQVRREL